MLRLGDRVERREIEAAPLKGVSPVTPIPGPCKVRVKIATPSAKSANADAGMLMV